VFLVDSKACTGRVEVHGDDLRSRRLDDAAFDYVKRGLGRHLRGAAVGLKRDIDAHLSRRVCFVSAVAAIWGDFPQREVNGDRVTYIAGEALAEWLRDQPQRLTTAEIDEYWDAVLAVAEPDRATVAA
jgi:hypothetical protein